jgi:hypothetical protein
LVVVALVGACVPGARPSGDDTIDLPAGVFEFPRHGRAIAAIASTGDELWLLRYPLQGLTGLTLLKTSTSGDELLVTDPLDNGMPSVREASIAMTSETVVAAWTNDSAANPYVRVLDHAGKPLQSAEQPIPLVDSGTEITATNLVQLTARPTGGTRLMASLDSPGAVHEVALVDLDAVGNPTGTVMFAGTNDDGQARHLATTTTAADKTLVAWDRNYDPCTGPYRPALALASDTTNMAAVQVLGDLPERSELWPAVAAYDTSAFIAWQTGWEGNTVAVASYDDLGGAITLATTGISPMLALGGADRGAVATMGLTTIDVTPFERSGTTLGAGTARTVSRVTWLANMWPIGLLHLTDQRYLIVWQEADSNEPNSVRVYGAMIDFDAPAPRPAPATTLAPPRPRFASALVPCSH